MQLFTFAMKEQADCIHFNLEYIYTLVSLLCLQNFSPYGTEKKKKKRNYIPQQKNLSSTNKVAVAYCYISVSRIT